MENKDLKSDLPPKKDEKKRVKDFETYSRSPFIPKPADIVKQWKLKIRKKRIKHGTGEFTSTETGEISQADLMVYGDWLVEEKQGFHKLYPLGREKMVDLKQCGVAMLSYTLKCLIKDSGQVYLSVDGFLEYSKYENKKSYYDGIFELLDKGYLSRCTREFDYFVNPNMMFNGRRFKIPEVWEITKEMIELQGKKYEKD